MARSGGVYTRAVSDYVFDTVISETDVNTEMDDIASEISNSIAADGQTTTTAQIPFASGIATNTVAERTSATGVTIDSVLMKDGRVDWNKGASVASASAPDIWSTTGNVIHITGTTQIDDFADAPKAGVFRIIEFDGALTLVHDAAKIDLPGGANITTAAGDRMLVYADSTTLFKVAYFRASGKAVTPDSRISGNILINGGFDVSQRGTTFTAATTPANSDDTYLLDRWILLSDGNDVVDVSQETSVVPVGSYAALKMDIETANKKAGILQIVEAKNAEQLIGGTATLSFKAEKVAGNATVDKLRAAVISWDSTADTVTSDVVSAWNGEGTDPTLATNWTYENTPSDLTLTDSFQTFAITGISIDTASTTNIAVFIWIDNADGTVGDLVYITDVQLESGSIATTYQHEIYSDTLTKCHRYYYRESSSVAAPIAVGYIVTTNTSARADKQLPVSMRVAPTMATSNDNDFILLTGSGSPAVTAVAYATDNDQNNHGRLTLTTGGGTQGDGCIFSFDAGGSRYIEWDAEL